MIDPERMSLNVIKGLHDKGELKFLPLYEQKLREKYL